VAANAIAVPDVSAINKFVLFSVWLIGAAVN
jgi:hypothetical protein